MGVRSVGSFRVRNAGDYGLAGISHDFTVRTGFSDGAGSAIGDSRVSGVGDAISQTGDGFAQGDATASGFVNYLFDGAGSAIGDATASGQGSGGDAAGSAIGDATASGGFSAFFDVPGLAQGDATASGGGDSTMSGISFSMTAGNQASITGYQQLVFGSIDHEPISGSTLRWCRKVLSNSGDIEFTGNQTTLSGKSVYVNSVQFPFSVDWATTGANTIAKWSTPPSFVSGSTYFIEIR